MKRIGWIGILAFVFLSGLVFAHGTASHVLGTLVETKSGQLVVRTRDDKTLMISVNEQTLYRRSDHSLAKLSDLKAGSRVVIEATSHDHGLMASEVRFSAGGETDTNTKTP